MIFNNNNHLVYILNYNLVYILYIVLVFFILIVIIMNIVIIWLLYRIFESKYNLLFLSRLDNNIYRLDYQITLIFGTDGTKITTVYIISRKFMKNSKTTEN